MPDLDIDGEVTRTLVAGSPAPLQLNDGTYKIIREGWGPGVVTMNRQKVRSPYVNGDFLVKATKEQVETPLAVRVTGSGYTDCWNKVGDLLRAFEQRTYTLTIVIEGTTFEYDCEPADYSVGEGGFFQMFHFRVYKQEIRLSIPRRPTPTQGPV